MKRLLRSSSSAIAIVGARAVYFVIHPIGWHGNLLVKGQNTTSQVELLVDIQATSDSLYRIAWKKLYFFPLGAGKEYNF